MVQSWIGPISGDLLRKEEENGYWEQLLVADSYSSTREKERSPLAPEEGGESLHPASFWGHTQDAKQEDWKSSITD